MKRGVEVDAAVRAIVAAHVIKDFAELYRQAQRLVKLLAKTGQHK